MAPALLHQLSRTGSLTPKTFAPALLHKLSRTGSPIHTEDFRSSAAPPTVKDRISNSHRRLSFQRCSTNCQGQDLQFTPKTFAAALLHQLSRTGSPIHTKDFRPSAAPPTVKDRISNSHRKLSLQRCSTNCQGQDLQITPKTFAPALLHQLSMIGSPIHTEDFLQQRCSTNCQGQVLQFTPKTFAAALLHQLSRTGSPIHTEDFRPSAAPPTVKDRLSNSHRKLSLQRCSTDCQGQDLQITPKTFAPALLHQLSMIGSPIHTEDFLQQRCSTNCQGQVLQFTPKTFVPALLHQLSRPGSPIHTEDFRSSATPPTVKDRISNSYRRLSFQRCSTNCKGQDLQFIPKTFVPRCSTNCQGQDLQFTPKTFVPALLHQLSRTGSPIHTENFRSSAAPPTVKDRFSNSHRRLSLQRCSTNCQGQVLQFTPKTLVLALLHQLSRTGSPIHTEDFRSSAAPPTVKDRISNSHRRLSQQRCSTNCQGQVLQFTPKTFAAALLHQLSRTGSPVHTENFRSSAAPPTVNDRFSNSHRRLSQQRCSTNCQGQVLQFTPKTFAAALLHQLSRTGSPIHTENFRSSAAPPTVKDRISNSHRKLSFQRCSTNCQGQDLQFTPKTFVQALLHQLSRTGFPIHTENFRSSAAPPTVKERFSNSNRRLSFQRCFTNYQRQDLQFTPKTFRSSAAPPTVKDGISNSHRRLSFQRCSTNCQGQVLQFTPKTFVPALFHQMSRTGSPIHTVDFRSNAAPPTVKDSLQFTPKTFAPALLHQLSRTGSPIHTEDFRSSAAPPTVKDRFFNSHRRLSLQRCSTNCQGRDLQFTPKAFVPALLHQLSWTGSLIHTEDFRSSAAPPTVKDRFSNSHRRLSIQRCSTNCQGQVLQFTPKTFDPALLHQLSRTGSPIHTEDFRSSAAPPTVKDRFSNSHRRLSFQRCSTNCQRHVLQFTPKTFVPALVHQVSKTGSPIHTEDFRSSAAPPTVKDRFSNSHRRLSLQRCSTNCQGQFSNSHRRLSFQRWSTNCQRQGSPIHTEDFRSSAAPPTVKDEFSNSHRRLSFQRWSTNCQGQVLQFTPKTFAPALLHQLSRTGSPIHTEDFRSSAAPPPPTVKDRFSNSRRRLSFQRCSTNCQGQVLQFTPKTFATALLHQLSRTGFPIHTEDFRSSAAPPTVKDRFSNSHRRLSFQRCSTICQEQVLQFTPKTFAPALLHQLSRTGCPIHTEDFPSSAGPPTVKDRFSHSRRRFSFQRCSTNCEGQVLQFNPKTFAPALLHQLSRTGSPIPPKTFDQRCSTNCQGQDLQLAPKTFVPALLHQLSRTCSPIHTEDFRSGAGPPTVKDRISNSHRRLSFQRCSINCQGQDLQFTPKTFVPALLHQLSSTRSPIHTEDFRSSGSLIHTENFRSSAAPPTVKDRFSNSQRKLSLQRCSTNCQGQVLQFTPKTFAPALLHQLSRTGSPIHTEDLRSNAVPPTVEDRFSNSNRKLSFQRCSTNSQGQVLQFTPKTFVPALLHQLSRTGSPIHTEDFRSSAAPPTVKDRFSNSHRRLSFQRCSTNCQGQVLQFTPKTFAPALLHQLSRTGSPIHTEDFRSSAAPPTVKDRFSNSHRRLSLQRCSTNCQGQVLQFTPKTFVPALLHQLSRTGSPIHTEDFRSSAAPRTVKDKFSNSH